MESKEVCDSIMKINIKAVIKINNGIAVNFISIRYEIKNNYFLIKP